MTVSNLIQPQEVAIATSTTSQLAMLGMELQYGIATLSLLI